MTINRKREVDRLLGVLKRGNARAREDAAGELGDWGDPRAVGPLGDVLMHDEDPWVRRRAAIALGELEDPGALAPLLRALEDPFYRERSEEWAEAYWPAGFPVREAARTALVWLATTGDRQVADTVVSLLDTELKEKGVYVAANLAAGGDPRALELLADVVHDSYTPPRVQLFMHGQPLPLSLGVHGRLVTEALGLIRDPAAGDVLAQVLDDPDEDVRLEAAKALGRLGDARGEEILVASLESEASWADLRGPQLEVAEALASLGNTRGIHVLEANLDDDADIRFKAAEALMTLADGRGEQTLLAGLESDNSYTRLKAAAALARRGDRRSQSILDDFENEDFWDSRDSQAAALRRECKEALAQLCDS